VRRAGGAIARTARKLTTKLNPRKRSAEKASETVTPRMAKPRTKPAAARPKQVRSDVPLDITDAYTPRQTSLKTSFRSDGADRQRDQEMPLGIGDEWKDEDHFTNKSGDARIGTHGRGHEAGERQRSSGNNNRR